MCGRFVLDTSGGELAAVYALTALPELAPRYNIAPGQPVAAVRAAPSGERELAMLRWGLIPPWAKDASIGSRMINARSETVLEKPSFKGAFRARRCILPASGFYEWERRGREKIPHYFHLRDGAPMSLAGVWGSWRSPEGETLESCTILTTVANDLVRPLHERMPVLLGDTSVERWLHGAPEEAEALLELLAPYPADQMEAWVVSREVNRPGHDSPECIRPV